MRQWISLGLMGLWVGVSVQGASAENLAQVYQLAIHNDPSLQAARETYEAQKEAVPLALSGVLPSLNLNANSTLNSPQGGDHFNSNGYSLTLTQPLLDLTAFESLSESYTQVKQAALTYAMAQQAEVLTVATDYFGVLQAQDTVRYATQYLAQLDQQLAQTKAMYQVGLKAYTDVQTTLASDESAKASVISAQSDLDSAKAVLEALTGTPIHNLAPLAQNFPLTKPSPLSETQWVSAALQGNLSVQDARLQVTLSQQAVTLARVGNGTIPGYTPTVDLNAGHTYSMSHEDTVSSSQGSALGISASVPLFNGGSTWASVNQAQFVLQSSQASLENTHRQTESQVKQAYLNVLSDISEVDAYQQAVISSEASLQASRAAYQAGTVTIVDLLTQESDLLSAEQQYTAALYRYITDSLTLKQEAGTLSVQDIDAINPFLVGSVTQMPGTPLSTSH